MLASRTPCRSRTGRPQSTNIPAQRPARATELSGDGPWRCAVYMADHGHQSAAEGDADHNSVFWTNRVRARFGAGAGVPASSGWGGGLRHRAAPPLVSRAWARFKDEHSPGSAGRRASAFSDAANRARQPLPRTSSSAPESRPPPSSRPAGCSRGRPVRRRARESPPSRDAGRYGRGGLVRVGGLVARPLHLLRPCRHAGARLRFAGSSQRGGRPARGLAAVPRLLSSRRAVRVYLTQLALGGELEPRL